MLKHKKKKKQKNKNKTKQNKKQNKKQKQKQKQIIFLPNKMFISVYHYFFHLKKLKKLHNHQIIKSLVLTPKQIKRCMQLSQEVASNTLEEGEDEAKFAWPLWVGPLKIIL